jgi:hypothetical protein
MPCAPPGFPLAAHRDRLMLIGPRAVGLICVEPTLPALSCAATRPHTAGRSVAIPTPRRPSAAIGPTAAARRRQPTAHVAPCTALPRIGAQVISLADSKLGYKRVDAVRHACCRATEPPLPPHRCSRREPPPAAFQRQHVPLLPSSCTHKASTLACWSDQAAGSPEWSFQRPPPPVSAEPARRSSPRRV